MLPKLNNLKELNDYQWSIQNVNKIITFKFVGAGTFIEMNIPGRSKHKH